VLPQLDQDAKACLLEKIHDEIARQCDEKPKGKPAKEVLVLFSFL
jgi:hypothetical protein